MDALERYFNRKYYKYNNNHIDMPPVQSSPKDLKLEVEAWKKLQLEYKNNSLMAENSGDYDTAEDIKNWPKWWEIPILRTNTIKNKGKQNKASCNLTTTATPPFIGVTTNPKQCVNTNYIFSNILTTTATEWIVLFAHIIVLI
jgi:hypothetical protein